MSIDRVEKLDRSPEQRVIYFKDAKPIRKPVKRRLYGPINSYYDQAP
ncbi:MAG: hypothetical protein ACR2JB_10480 [Bryobacteraceae bacterium]